MIARRLIRSRAKDLLRSCQIITPPVDVDALAAKLGILISVTELTDDVSGFLVRKEDKVIIAVTSNDSPKRRRFTAAHEIGHFLLHMSKPIFVDEFAVHFRSRASGQGFSQEEMEANTFAAELLMPDDWLAQDVEKHGLGKDGLVRSLALRYEVSEEALAFRLTNLGYSLYF